MDSEPTAPTPDEQDSAAEAAGLPVPERTEAERASQQPAVLEAGQDHDADVAGESQADQAPDSAAAPAVATSR